MYFALAGGFPCSRGSRIYFYVAQLRMLDHHLAAAPELLAFA